LEATPYGDMSELSLLALCIFREARGEPMYAKRAVAHVIKNRADKPGWWGRDVVSVILAPYQFSSFNSRDVNAGVWPEDASLAWTDCLAAASAVLVGDEPDNTDGATYYFDRSISFPKSWGEEKNFRNTLNVGRLRFWKPITNSVEI
jgi:N-acetylmuramoyl-L-alanine amidase